MQNEADWGLIRQDSWRIVPVIRGRIAVERDVKEGRATFYQEGGDAPAEPYPISLPHCAWLDSNDGAPVPVVAIQAEQRYDGKIILGVRFLAGGNGVCTLEELRLVNEPDERFFNSTS